MKQRIFLVFTLIIFSLPSGAEENLLTPLANLKTVATESRDKKIPLLITFTAAHNPFCVSVMEELFHPMQRGGLYTYKVIMRAVDLVAAVLR